MHRKADFIVIYSFPNYPLNIIQQVQTYIQFLDAGLDPILGLFCILLVVIVSTVGWWILIPSVVLFHCDFICS